MADSDQPDGIDQYDYDLPIPTRAAARVAEFVRRYGDGRIWAEAMDGLPPQPPLYARDLEALTRLADGTGRSDPTRDPVAVVAAARRDWTTWQSGDGSRYAVRVLGVTTGSDAGDAVLLVGIGRRTAAFQYPTAPYRLAESGRWTAAMARRHGTLWAWGAARPLLRELGVTEEEPTARRPITDVELPDDQGGERR